MKNKTKDILGALCFWLVIMGAMALIGYVENATWI